MRDDGRLPGGVGIEPTRSARPGAGGTRGSRRGDRPGRRAASAGVRRQGFSGWDLSGSRAEAADGNRGRAGAVALWAHSHRVEVIALGQDLRRFRGGLPCVVNRRRCSGVGLEGDGHIVFRAVRCEPTVPIRDLPRPKPHRRVRGERCASWRRHILPVAPAIGSAR